MNINLLMTPRLRKIRRIEQQLDRLGSGASGHFWHLRLNCLDVIRYERWCLERRPRFRRLPIIKEHTGARREINRRARKLDEIVRLIEEARRSTDSRSHWLEVQLDWTHGWLLKAILEKLREDEDPRDLIFESVKHRPKETALSKALALYVALSVRNGTTEKAAKVDAATLSGATADQVKHALRDYRAVCELVVDSFDLPDFRKPAQEPSHTDLLFQWCGRYLQHRRPRSKHQGRARSPTTSRPR